MIRARQFRRRECWCLLAEAVGVTVGKSGKQRLIAADPCKIATAERVEDASAHWQVFGNHPNGSWFELRLTEDTDDVVLFHLFTQFMQ